MKILLTGGSGRLGTELQKIRKFEYVPTRKEMDITSKESIELYTKDKQIDLIVHCAAIVSTDKNQISDQDLYVTNVVGTWYLVSKAPTLFISTEYVFDGLSKNYSEYALTNPLNFYAETKKFGENVVIKNDGKVIRAARMASNPWPYEFACNDMYTSGDYLDVMAKEINLAIDLFNELPDIVHIGTERKSVLDLARQTNPNVKEISRLELNSILPYDCSFNTDLWKSIKKKYLMDR